MEFSIDDIRAKLTGGGARATLFSVVLANPWDANLGINSPYMVKASSLPASVLGEIQVGYMGRKMKVAGDRNYDDWEVTVINDENFAIRESLEAWSNAIQGPVSNRRNGNATSSLSYKNDGQITQYDKLGKPIYEYKFVGMYPKEIGAITVDWDTENTIETFTATFAFDYFVRTL